MGLLGQRGRAFWDGSRFTTVFVAERPKAGKARDEGFLGRNKDGEKKRVKKPDGAGQLQTGGRSVLVWPCPAGTSYHKVCPVFLLKSSTG